MILEQKLHEPMQTMISLFVYVRVILSCLKCIDSLSILYWAIVISTNYVRIFYSLS